MRVLKSQGILAIGAAAALVGAMASGQVACSSSSSGNGTSSSSSGSSSGAAEEGGTDSGSSSGSSSGGSSGSSSGSGTDAGTEPTISITSPTNGMMVTPMGATDAVNVEFTATNFMFFAPGAPGCDAMSDNCGHVHVLVDGNACTPDGAPYDNADATGSPAVAILNTCPMVDGQHKITLELHHTNHSPIQVGGMTVQDSVMVTVGAGDASSD